MIFRRVSSERALSVIRFWILAAVCRCLACICFAFCAFAFAISIFSRSVRAFSLFAIADSAERV